MTILSQNNSSPPYIGYSGRPTSPTPTNLFLHYNSFPYEKIPLIAIEEFFLFIFFFFQKLLTNNLIYDII